MTVETSNNNAAEVTLVARESQDLSVDIQLAQVGKDYYGAMATQVQHKMYEFDNLVGNDIDLSSFAGMLVGAARQGAKISQMESYDTYVATGDYLKAAAPQVLTSGSNGSLAAFATRNVLYEFYFCIEEDNNAHIGRPLSDYRQLSTIPGFILIEHPDISLNCFETERSLIRRFMQGGFFYE